MTNLRRAKLDDHWRRLYKREYPISIDKITFNGGDIFGGLSIELEPGLTVIVGKNGTGKSNFVRSVFNILASPSSNRRRFDWLIENNQIALEYRLDHNSKTYASNALANPENGALDFECFIYDPCNLIPEIQTLFHSQENIEELVEGFSLSSLTEDQMKLVNFITNSNYTNIQVANIEDEYELFPLLPYFIVSQNGVTYDSRAMGLGELSLLYFYWLIDYIEKKEEPCILLIEEPESFLPPKLQNRLSDIIAKTVDSTGTWCLVSTHSQQIIEKIKRSHLKILTKDENSICFKEVDRPASQLKPLGLASRKKGLIICEDDAALRLIKCLIKFSPEHVVDAFHYHISGSYSSIASILNLLPRRLTNFSIVGIFDGDCRKKLNDEMEQCESYIYLPSSLAPDRMLMEYFQSLDLARIEQRFSLDTARLMEARDSAAGADHHDYFHDVANQLELTYNNFFASICDAWIEDEQNSEEVQSFHDDLNQIWSN